MTKILITEFINQNSLENLNKKFDVKYDEKFWSNISLPAETNFYKKNIKELESLYNVPIKTQFQYSNRN